MSINNMVTAVMRTSANRAARSMRTVLSSKIREKYNIRKVDLDRKLKIVPANRSAEPLLIISSRRIGLYKFGGRQTGRGASAAITRGNRRVYRRSWIGAVGSGGIHTGIFYRVTRKRYPIAELYAITEGQMAWNKLTQGVIMDTYAQRFQTEFTNRLQFRIGSLIRGNSQLNVSGA